VTFTVKSSEPVPFNRCYCTVCRKTAGAGGFAINIGADFNTLEIEGREHIRVYRARIPNTETGEITVSKGERSFCELCGSALWAWDPDWPDLVHPHASAIDTDLPVPPFNWHMMLGSKASKTDSTDHSFPRYRRALCDPFRALRDASISSFSKLPSMSASGSKRTLS
jgi:hypothetical protein